MVAVRISRLNAEVLAGADSVAGISRVEAEIATAATQASTSAVRVSRVSIEVLARNAPSASITRVEAEIATAATQASTSAVRVSRASLEVLAANTPTASITRVEAEVATAATMPSTDAVRVSRVSVEALARRGFAGMVSPLALADGIEVFLHNWVTEAELSTTYKTDVRSSVATGSESRRGLILKPDRSLKFVWELHCDVDRIDRLLVMLRKLTDERIAVPLYMDQRELAASALAATNELFFDTTKGRWHIGARVVVVQFNGYGQYLTHNFYILSNVQNDRLVVQGTLGVNIPAGSVVMPMIDCEVTLEAEAEEETALHARVSMDLQEVQGVSALPPLKADFPTGAQSFGDYPIFTIEPDWSKGIRVGRSRQGRKYQQGRANRTYVEADRSRQTHDLDIVEERDEAWPAVEFFDTRRGRLRTFCLVDQQQVWSTVSIDPSGQFVSINEQGDFDDFSAELEGGWIGLVMRDGTVYVRDVVTVQQILTVYRLTLGTFLPAGLSASDVVRVARARYTRFSSDEMVEKWKHTGLMSTNLKFIEALDEAQYDT